MDRRRRMDRRGEGDNEHRKKILLLEILRLMMYSLKSFESPGWFVWIGISVCRLCLPLQLLTPFIGLR